MFRVHGTSHAKELWQFDADTQKILLGYDQLRYRLIPYIYSLSWDVTHNRGTLMRPLVMDFQDDPHSPLIADQYMFGKALLVNPVVQEGARVRTVYLPGSTPWYNFWSGEKWAPGQIIAVQADLATLPLFVRAGSILPLGPMVHFADEKTAEPTELRVYPGADGHFTLYDDAGDGYGYEKGEYATIDLSWSDSRQELTLGARKGKFPGMIALANFSVSCGASRSATPPQAVSYRGKSVTIHLSNCRGLPDS
jgi:alpha-D-xyloside xylohydrolase